MNNLKISEEQRQFAKYLGILTNSGFIILVLGFLIYISGVLPSNIPVEKVPQYWQYGVNFKIDKVVYTKGKKGDYNIVKTDTYDKVKEDVYVKIKKNDYVKINQEVFNKIKQNENAKLKDTIYINAYASKVKENDNIIIPTGWQWIYQLNKGDIISFVGIVFLAGISSLCFLFVLPIYIKKKDTTYLVMVILQIIVLILGASGLISTGSH